jgi:hypothetical protein
MQLPKRSITTDYKVSQLTEEELQFYRWLSFRQPNKFTLAQIDEIVAPHKLTDEELQFYVKLDKLNRYPSHWKLIQELYKKHNNSDSENVIDDSDNFKTSFCLADGQGSMRKEKLYALYYEWSELPMSRDKFFSIFPNRFYAIPKESSMIRAFIVMRRNKKAEDHLRSIRRREELAEIMYGREEKAVKKALWNFW